MNAFKYGCSVDGENFCARPDLSKSLSTYVESGQNLVIQGERRIGKTSLVKETVSSMRGWSMLYADFMGVKSVTDVCNRIADALARFDSSDSFMRRIFAALVHLRPVATVDAVTGLPTISVDARASAAPSSVNTVMNAVKAHVKGRKACVVFDEFQDILDVKDGEQMLALMRGRIQFMPHTSFVFLGSARNAMMDIFMSPKSPFYKSAAVFDVGTLFIFRKKRARVSTRIKGTLVMFLQKVCPIVLTRSRKYGIIRLLMPHWSRYVFWKRVRTASLEGASLQADGLARHVPRASPNWQEYAV